MKQRLYRTIDPLLGECVHTHWSMGDAYPLVSREVYEQLPGLPQFLTLPDEHDYELLVRCDTGHGRVTDGGKIFGT